MKQLLIAILLFFSVSSYAQVYQQMSQYGVEFKRMDNDSVTRIPRGLGSIRSIPGYDTAQLRYNIADSSVYVHTGNQWIKAVRATGSDIYNSNGTLDGNRTIDADGNSFNIYHPSYFTVQHVTSGNLVYNENGLTLQNSGVNFNGELQINNNSGDSGQVLMSNGNGNNPSWEYVGSGVDSTAYHTVSSVGTNGFSINTLKGVKDTIIFNIPDTSNKFVSQIYRTAGKDSIFYRIGTQVYAIKDSTGGGSVSGLTPNKLLFGRSDGTIKQDTSLHFDTSTRKLTVGYPYSTTYINSGDTIVFIGNSVCQGSSSTNNYYRFTTVATRQLFNNYGMVEKNLGASGSTVSDALNKIPTKRSNMAVLVMHYGINEVGSSWSYSTFVTEYKKALDSAIARGWAANRIYITSISGVSIGLSGYSTATQRQFNTVMDSLATVYGATYVDMYECIQVAEYNYLAKGILHPYDEGHEILGYIMAGAIINQFKTTQPKFAVNGIADFSKIRFNNQYFINRGHLLAIDDSGRVGVSRLLEDRIQTAGRLILGGGILQRGATMTTTFDSTQDILLKAGARFHIGVASTNRAVLDLFSTNGQTTLANYYAGGTMNFNVSGGVTGGAATGLSIAANQTVTIPGELTVGYGKSISVLTGSGNAKLSLLTATLNTELNNYASVGTVSIGVSAGVTNSTIQKSLQLFPSGRTQIQAGGTFTDITSARFAVNSTTEGLLIPRMTAANVTSISSPANGLLAYNRDSAKVQLYDSVAARWAYIPKVLINTATLDFGNTVAGAATDLTITVTGAQDGDPVAIGVVNASVPANGSFRAWVSATNTVTVRFVNNDLTTAYDPASGVFKVSVFK
jgi:hypothetical protein